MLFIIFLLDVYNIEKINNGKKDFDSVAIYDKK
jgi:hypothetical protein